MHPSGSCDFRSVVQDYSIRQRLINKELVLNAADLLPTNEGIHFNRGHSIRAKISHRQALEPAAIGQPVINKTPRITESGVAGQPDARGGRDLLPRQAAEQKPLFPIDPLDILLIHSSAFSSQPHADPRAAVASLGVDDLSHPRPEHLVV